MPTANTLQRFLPAAAVAAGAIALAALLGATSLSLEGLVLIAAVAGLAAVLAEIVVRDPSVLWDIVTDSRKLAQPEDRPAQAKAPAQASNDDFRKAA